MIRRAFPGAVAGAIALGALAAQAQQVTIESPITGDSAIIESPLDPGDALPGPADPATGPDPAAQPGDGTQPDPGAQPGDGETLSPFGLGDEPSDTIDLGPINEEPVIQPAEIAEKGVLLRALDKLSGELVDFDLAPNQTKQLGRIQVTLGECRYPVDNPTGDAAAFLSIRNAGSDSEAFRGWMLASSPALNALDHPRYDVWVLNCITE